MMSQNLFNLPPCHNARTDRQFLQWLHVKYMRAYFAGVQVCTKHVEHVTALLNTIGFDPESCKQILC